MNNINQKIIKGTNFIFNTPYNISLIILSLIYYYILLAPYSSNQGFDMMVTHQSNMLNLSFIGIICGFISKTKTSDFLIKISIITVFLSLITITAIKSFISIIIISKILLISNVFCGFLVIKNLWIISNDKIME